MNYIDRAIEGDALAFAETVRDALDAYAHGAIEQIKDNIVSSDTIDESVDGLIDSVHALDEQQLEDYYNQLTEEQAEQLATLMIERAKYGTKKGRRRLAKKIRKGKDIGKKGKNFEMIARKAAKRYGSAKRGRAVAAAAMWKRYGGKK